MKRLKKSKESKIKKILHNLLMDGFFDGEGKTVSEAIKKLDQRGFIVKGKKIGMISRILTQMCQDPTTGLERYEITQERKQLKGEKYIFKRVKK